MTRYCNNETPVAETLSAMAVGDTAAFPIGRLTTVCATANRLKLQKRGKWTTARRVDEGWIEVTRTA